METKQRIANIVTREEIDKWKPGDRILIWAQTGTGKSYFIKNNFYDYCKENNLKALFLSNRSLLKRQNISDLGEKSKIIKSINYQTLEKEILNGVDTLEIFAGYDVIIYDEVHYIFTDSEFNRNTDLLMEPIKNPHKNKIFIFITATPIALRQYNREYEYVYTLSKDYTYIESLYFYTNKETPELIIRNLPKDEKAIYFCSRAEEAYELSKKFEDSAFICSEGNRLHKYVSKTVVEELSGMNKDKNKKEKTTLSCKYLFTTKALDNGVSIEDPALKHIIIDMLDPVTLIQCLGRRRIDFDNPENVIVYIKDYNRRVINYHLVGIEKKLQTAFIFENLGAEDFQREYRKKEFDSVIDNNFVLNQAKLQNYQTEQLYLKQMFEDEDGRGYRKYICNILDFDIEQVKEAELEFQMKNIKQVLEKWQGIKMFKEEQETFRIDFFSRMFPNATKIDYRKRGINSMNAIVDEEKLPYHIFSFVEKSGEMRDKTYWIVIGPKS
jgi:superfamily II DNA or RNA helicase